MRPTGASPARRDRHHRGESGGDGAAADAAVSPAPAPAPAAVPVLGVWVGLRVWAAAWVCVLVVARVLSGVVAGQDGAVAWVGVVAALVVLHRAGRARVRVWCWSAAHAGSHLAWITAPVGPGTAVAAVLGVVATVSVGVAARSGVLAGCAGVLSVLAAAGTAAALGAA